MFMAIPSVQRTGLLGPRVVTATRGPRVIAVAENDWPEGLPRYDYYVFDESEVWRMHYNADFTFHGAELLEGPDILADHLRWRDVALAKAIPLRDYHGLEMIEV